MDWEAWAGPLSAPGPPLRVRVSRDEAHRLAVEAGFRIVAEKSAGPDYYMLLLED
jgi:hypothetical protein